MEDRFEISQTRGKKKVTIENDGYSLIMSVRRNGFQSTGFGVDDEILSMIVEVISNYTTKGETK